MRLSSILQNRMFKETLIYSIGSFGSRILSFLLIPFYTYFFTKKELGEYDLLITTISLFAPLVSLQLSDATYRWLIDLDKRARNTNDLSKIITNSLLGYLVSMVVFAICFVIFIFFYPFKYNIYFLVILFLNGLLPFLQNILRGSGETKAFAINGVITSFLIISFNVIFIYFCNFKIEGILLANIIAYILACSLILYKINIHKNFNIKFCDIGLLKKMLRYSLPLIPNLMSWWLISSASKYIIVHFLGSESNGIYAISTRLPGILVIINSVLILPLQDGILKKESKLEDYRKFLYQFFKMEFGLIMILIVLSPIFTKYILNESFYESWRYMGFLFIGVGLNTLGAVLGLVYQKNLKTIKITYTTLIGAVVSVIFSYVLIQFYGLMGLSFAYMFGFLIMFYIRFLDTKQSLNLNIGSLHIFIYISLLLGVNIITLYLDFYKQIILAVVVILLLLITNKKLILNVITKN